MIVLMIFLLISFRYTLDDMAFGVWTGGNVFFDRAVNLAKTWFQFVPQMDLYTDFIPKKGYKKIYEASKHLNLFIHVTPTFDEYIKFTSNNNIWNVVQNRHLFTIYDIYRRYPNKKWYVICDDDTVIQPNLIPYFLDLFNYSHQRPKLIGHSLLHLNVLIKYTHDGKITHFAQGGAGMIFSHSLMEDISSEIMNCSIMKQGFNYPSDVRLIHCINEIYAYYNGTNRKEKNKLSKHIIENAHGWLNGMELEFKDMKKAGKSFISYHKITDDLYSLLYNATYSIWTDLNNQERYCDFSFITGSIINIQFLNKNQITKMMFGINIQLFNFTSCIRAISPFKPIFDKDDKKHIQPIQFIQQYENDFEISLFCNENLENDEIVFDSFYPIGKKGINYVVKCPKSQTFLVTSKKSSSVRHPIIYDDYRY